MKKKFSIVILVALIITTTILSTTALADDSTLYCLSYASGIYYTQYDCNYLPVCFIEVFRRPTVVNDGDGYPGTVAYHRCYGVHEHCGRSNANYCSYPDW